MGKRSDHQPTVSAEQRRELCNAVVTLNGKRAKIISARSDFARVVIVSEGMGCEFAWTTVALVVSRGGKFTA
jgi:hypothetical protein